MKNKLYNTYTNEKQIYIFATKGNERFAIKN